MTVLDKSAIEAALQRLPIGYRERTSGRTIGEGEFALLTDLTWTIGQFHTNAEYARSSPFGYPDRILGGPVLLALVSGQWSLGSHRRKIETLGGIRLGPALGAEVRYRAPFFPGDTMYVETVLESARASQSNPGLGILVVADTAINQRDEVGLETKRPITVWPAADSQPGADGQASG